MSLITDAVKTIEDELTGLKNDFTLIANGIAAQDAKIQLLTDKLSQQVTLSDEDKAAIATLATDSSATKVQADNLVASFAARSAEPDPALAPTT